MRTKQTGHKDWDRYQRAREEQADYTAGFMQHMTDVVCAIFEEDADGNRSILIPTLDTLDWHVQATPAYLQSAYEELGTLQGLLRQARNERDQARAKAKLLEIEKANKSGSKIPAEHVLQTLVVLDKASIDADEVIGQVEGQIKVVEGTIAALNMKASYIPGLQGARNRTSPSNTDETRRKKDR